MRNPTTMAPYEDFITGLTAEHIPDLKHWVEAITTNRALTPDQKRAALAFGAAKVLPHLPYSPAALEGLASGMLCMLGEVPLPAWPRYTAPDYRVLLKNGSRFLSLPPATDLHDALAALLACYQHSATVTLEPVWLGHLDSLLEPYWDTVPEAEARRALRSFWTVVSRLFPSSFVHANIGPAATRVGEALLELERAQTEPINLTFRYDVAATPHVFAEAAARTAMQQSKPYFHNHALSAQDWGGDYAVASCYNLMPVGGGVHTLVRLNLAKVAAASPADYLERALPEAAALLCEVLDARSRFLGAESGFFAHCWQVAEGLLRPEAFTAYAGFFGLAEAVNSLLAAEGKRYGRDAEANQLAAAIIERLAAAVAEHPVACCEATGGRACVHAQVGIDSDTGFTPAGRVPGCDEPPLYQHIRAVSPLDRLVPGGISTIFEFEATAAENPAAVLDIVRGAFALGNRNLALGPNDGELIRVSGYLMRRSDLAKVRGGEETRGDGARFGTGVFDNRPEHFQRRVRTV